MPRVARGSPSDWPPWLLTWPCSCLSISLLSGTEESLSVPSSLSTRPPVLGHPHGRRCFTQMLPLPRSRLCLLPTSVAFSSVGKAGCRSLCLLPRCAPRMRSDTRAVLPHPYGALSHRGPNIPEGPGEEGSFTPCQAVHGVCASVICEVCTWAACAPNSSRRRKTEAVRAERMLCV